MRAISLTAINLTAMAALLLFGSELPSQAQAPDASSRSQSLTGPGGKDSRDDGAAPEKAKTDHAEAGATKASATKTSATKTSETAAEAKKEAKKGEAVTKSDAKSRMNTLSPEEQRRAARARERAATKVTKATGGKPGGDHGDKTALPTPAAKALPAPVATTGASPHPVAAAAKPPRKTSVAQTRGRRGPGSRTGTEQAARGWVPRVGGVVPRGVPLYPVPPGYRPGPGYGGGPVYVVRRPGPYFPTPDYPRFPRVGQAYPAFPRIRGDVDIDDDN